MAIPLDTQPPDISQLKGHFVFDQVVAGGVLVATVLVILILMRLVGRGHARKFAERKGLSGISPTSITGNDTGPQLRNLRRWRLLVGLDNRVSTSHTVALMWTLTVAYILLTLTLIALAPHAVNNRKGIPIEPIPAGQIPDGWVSAAFRPLDATYLAAMFGVSVIAAIAARSIVTRKVASGTLQKTRAARPSTLDLVTDDTGSLDLADFQWALFSVIGVVFVLTQFSTHPSTGVPTIPGALTGLIAASGAAYTVNKATESNPPRVDTILNSAVKPGTKVTLVGSNLTVPTDGLDAAGLAAETKVALSHSRKSSPDAVDALTATPSQVTFRVPENTPAGKHWDVIVTTNTGARAVNRAGLRVVAGAQADLHEDGQRVGSATHFSPAQQQNVAGNDDPLAYARMGVPLEQPRANANGGRRG